MSYVRRRQCLWILFLLGLVLIALTARATTFVRLRFDELAARAHAVARLRCLSVESRWEQGEIWTFTSFEVLEAPKGALPGLVTVRTLGGRDASGGFVSTVEGSPRFESGEEVYLFLLTSRTPEFRVLGWAQGTFRVERDARTGIPTVTQDSAAVPVLDPETLRFRRLGIRRMPLEQFRQKLADAIARAENGEAK